MCNRVKIKIVGMYFRVFRSGGGGIQRNKECGNIPTHVVVAQCYAGEQAVCALPK